MWVIIAYGGKNASPERIKEALNSLNIALFEIDRKKYYLKIKGADLGNRILRLQHNNPLKNMGLYEELKLQKLKTTFKKFSLLVAKCHFLKIKSQDLCGIEGKLTNSWKIPQRQINILTFTFCPKGHF